jgi:hypothetical protein
MMRLTIFQILAFTFFISCSLARNLSFLEQNPNVIANRSVPEDDRVKITKRDDTKYVFMHLVSSVQYIFHVYI